MVRATRDVKVYGICGDTMGLCLETTSKEITIEDHGDDVRITLGEGGSGIQIIMPIRVAVRLGIR